MGCHIVIVGEDVNCVSGGEFREELFDSAACWRWEIDLAIGRAYGEGSCVGSDGQARSEAFTVSDTKLKCRAVTHVSNRSR